MMLGRIQYIAAAGTLVVCLALGRMAPAQTPNGMHAPDPRRGAVIAAQGVATGAPGCAQCHAFNGASDGSGAFPRIAGQSAGYLAKQRKMAPK